MVGVVGVVVVVSEKKNRQLHWVELQEENHAANAQHRHRHDDASPPALPLLLLLLLPRAGPSPHSNENSTFVGADVDG